MVNENYFKVKKLLLYGMIGAVLTMIGDFLLLGVDSNGAIGALGHMEADNIIEDLYHNHARNTGGEDSLKINQQLEDNRETR